MSETSVYDTAIYAAVEKAGGVSQLGKLLGVTRTAVYEWLQRGYVPTKRAIQIEDMYGIPRGGLMKPDLIEILGSTSNPTARKGAVRYEPRARPKSAPKGAEDLV